jgi:hypothetical protein
MTVTTVSLYNTIYGRDFFVFATGDGSPSKLLHPDFWENGSPAPVDLRDDNSHTAAASGTTPCTRIGPNCVMRLLNFHTADGREVTEFVRRQETWSHCSDEPGLLGVKTDDPYMHFNVQVFGVDATGPWATRACALEGSGPVDYYEDFGSTVCYERPTEIRMRTPRFRWLFDLATGELLNPSVGAPAPNREFVPVLI